MGREIERVIKGRKGKRRVCVRERATIYKIGPKEADIVKGIGRCNT